MVQLLTVAISLVAAILGLLAAYYNFRSVRLLMNKRSERRWPF